MEEGIPEDAAGSLGTDLVQEGAGRTARREQAGAPDLVQPPPIELQRRTDEQYFAAPLPSCSPLTSYATQEGAVGSALDYIDARIEAPRQHQDRPWGAGGGPPDKAGMAEAEGGGGDRVHRTIVSIIMELIVCTRMYH